MKLEAKQRLTDAATEIAAASVKLTAADAKQAAAYLTQTFAKHGLGIKVKPSVHGDTTLTCTEKTKYGNIDFDLDLKFKKGGSTYIEVDFRSADLFATKDLTSDDFKLTKLGKKGAREFKKFATSYAKEANATFLQLQFAGQWIVKFAAAFEEITDAMAANKTRVGKEFR